MRSYPPIIAEETERMIADWGDEGEVDILAVMKELTVYTSTRCLIGEEFRSGITDEFFHIYDDLERGVDPLAYLMPNLPIPKFRRRDAARAQLQEIVEEMMRRRRSKVGTVNDGLQILLDSTYDDGSKLTANELTGILIALILAGHHTSAGSVVWILVELLRNEKFLQPVIDEIDDVTWDADALTYPMLREATGLGAVVKEVLRLHPPLIFLFRKVLRDFKFRDHVVTPGKMLCAAPVVSHRMEEIFPDAGRFDPTRYANESQSDPFSLIGFGGGSHKCTGNAFGTMQLKVISLVLLKKYHFELVSPPGEYKDDYTRATVLPTGPCLLRYRARDRRTLVKPNRRHLEEKRDIPTSELCVTVDRHLCQGHAVCVSEAPEVFEVGGESVVEVVLDPETSALRKTSSKLQFYPATELNQQVVCAARFCPNKAITIEEAGEVR